MEKQIREEIRELRNIIASLESRVKALEGENYLVVGRKAKKWNRSLRNT